MDRRGRGTNARSFIEPRLLLPVVPHGCRGTGSEISWYMQNRDSCFYFASNHLKDTFFNAPYQREIRDVFLPSS